LVVLGFLAFAERVASGGAGLSTGGGGAGWLMRVRNTPDKQLSGLRIYRYIT
jgi:hypothetical protein